jgi:glucose/arabinose dehydrogenase
LIEEVDIVVRGGNYGWNVLEGSQCYNAASCDGSQTMLPVAEYTHADGCAVTGGYVYRGEQMPELEGWYIYGDFCSGQVWGVTADEGVERTPVRLATTGLEISSFAEDPSGEIWVIGYQTGVYRLVRK